jgi:hypothetical protein
LDEESADKMHLVIAISILLFLALLVGAVLLIRKVAFAGGSLPVTAEWIGELSVERYRPMMRLLDGADLEFLRSQPGFKPEMADRIREQRCDIFAGYLRSLEADFRRVCSAIHLLMLQSRDDRPDLAAVLVHHQLMFAGGMLMIHVRLFFYRWGICGVDVGSVVKVFDVMQLELRSLVPAAVAAGA